MKNLTIGKHIALGFASVIIITLALGAFAYMRLLAISSHSDHIAKTSLPGVELVLGMEKNLRVNETLIYKHTGSVDKQDIERLEAEMGALSIDNTKKYEALDQLVTDEKGRELLDKLKNLRVEYLPIRARVLDLSRQGTNNTAAYDLARSQLDPISNQYFTAMGALVDYMRADADNTSAGIQAVVQTSKAGILIGLSLTCLAGLGLSFFIVRGISRTLHGISNSINDGSNQVSSASAQVSAASQTLAEGSSEQAASLEETGSSLEEMASMTKRNSENARKANELAKEARTAADKGVGDMQTMAAAMDDIKVSSDDIAKIIKTIDEIAFQTNILALNAAVEAARAGEAGMGFAVVADEVRNLAQRCARAAKETAGKIEGAITKTGQGVEISGKVAATLNEIVTKVRQVDDLVSEVAGASREQTEGITQINSAVAQMDRVTQSNAAGAEESAAAAEELNAQAIITKQSVQELIELVGGQSPPPPAVTLSAPSNNLIHPQSSIAKSSVPTNGKANGHGSSVHLNPASAKRGITPLGNDFKRF